MADAMLRSGMGLNGPQSTAVDRAVEQLEELWESRKRDRYPELPAIVPLLPPESDPYRTHVLVELIKVDQERRWRSGLKKSLDEYLAEWPELPREPSLVAELLEAELQTRAAFGSLPTLKELHQCYPDLPSAVLGRLLGAAVPPPGSMVDTPASGSGSTPRNGLPIRCPHCRNSDALTPNCLLADLTCRTCGKSFIAEESSPATPPPFPVKIGRFPVIEWLGKGGFGTVWKANDEQLKRPVAIKVPRQSGANLDETERFLREARTVAQLKHPNIVSVHEAGRDGDTLFIVSDYIRGATLDELLTDHPFGNRAAAELCAKIADGLHHAHTQGIIHRDLKPANIMIDGDGEPHLMDFGLARRDAGEVTMTCEGQLLGTPAYMSPEQAQGNAHTADRRSDIYSLGVILYQLLTGVLPFRGNTPIVTMQQVACAEPPRPRKLNAKIPKDLETITLKCLEKAPELRYQHAQEVASELNRFLCGDPLLARPIGRFTRLWKRVQRTPTLAGLLVTSTILLSVVLIQLIGRHPVKYAASLLRGMNPSSILYDDFENYEFFSWPSTWTKKWNAEDTSNSGIAQDPTDPSNRVLKLFGTEINSASATRSVNFPTAFIVNARIYNYGTSQTRSEVWGRGSMSIEGVTALFTFYAGGKYPAGTLNLGAFELPYENERWYDISVLYQHNDGSPTAKYWLDDRYVGEAHLTIPISGAIPERLELNGGSSAYFDDIEVRRVADFQ